MTDDWTALLARLARTDADGNVTLDGAAFGDLYEAWLRDAPPETGPTLTMTPGVVLALEPEALGKMIQDRVRRGLIVVRIEELDVIAERIGIPLVRSDAD